LGQSDPWACLHWAQRAAQRARLTVSPVAVLVAVSRVVVVAVSPFLMDAESPVAVAVVLVCLVCQS
jgi:hypothetical protein